MFMKVNINIKQLCTDLNQACCPCFKLYVFLWMYFESNGKPESDSLYVYIYLANKVIFHISSIISLTQIWKYCLLYKDK